MISRRDDERHMSVLQFSHLVLRKCLFAAVKSAAQVEERIAVANGVEHSLDAIRQAP